MAKTILPYNTHNSLSKLIQRKAQREGKLIRDIEKELTKYCALTSAGTIKKYKDNSINPCLPIALRISEYFGISLENIWELREG
jgi:DNA-binding XRE family transcriptional regulator